MIVSMTGFGDAAAERSGTHYAVEIRSLNNRFFKPVIKLPETISGLEPELESGPKVVMVTSLVTEETPADSIDLMAADAKGSWRVRTPKLDVSGTRSSWKAVGPVVGRIWATAT